MSSHFRAIPEDTKRAVGSETVPSIKLTACRQRYYSSECFITSILLVKAWAGCASLSERRAGPSFMD